MTSLTCVTNPMLTVREVRIFTTFKQQLTDNPTVHCMHGVTEIASVLVQRQVKIGYEAKKVDTATLGNHYTSIIIINFQLPTHTCIHILLFFIFPAMGQQILR